MTNYCITALLGTPSAQSPNHGYIYMMSEYRLATRVATVRLYGQHKFRLIVFQFIVPTNLTNEEIIKFFVLDSDLFVVFQMVAIIHTAA